MIISLFCYREDVGLQPYDSEKSYIDYEGYDLSFVDEDEEPVYITKDEEEYNNIMNYYWDGIENVVYPELEKKLRSMIDKKVWNKKM